MLQGGAAEYAESAPWIPLLPGLAIRVRLHLFGDSLRDVLDPKLRTL
jgi:peptide/nickel transport system permease protein